MSYDLVVVPMFILMGNVISKTGIAHDLFRAAYAFVGNVRGGLALSTMVACSGFSAVCGSSYARGYFCCLTHDLPIYEYTLDTLNR